MFFQCPVTIEVTKEIGLADSSDVARISRCSREGCRHQPEHAGLVVVKTELSAGGDNLQLQVG
jgi:hypothetical protein